MAVLAVVAVGCANGESDRGAAPPTTATASEDERLVAPPTQLPEMTTAPSTVATTAPVTSPPPTSAATSTTLEAPPSTAGVTLAPAAPPQVDAVAYTLVDPATGSILASSEPDARLPVGSLIKLLTAYEAFAAADPDKVAVAPDGLIVDPAESQIGIFPGQQLDRALLIRAMLIVSANDAARMLAIDVAGSEQAFADRMNAAAAQLGLSNTHAVNVTGLDADGQHSSAQDLARLAAALMDNATFREIVQRRDATLNGLTLPATNDFLDVYPGADGTKTGHTTGAGYCIVASASRGDRRLIAVVLGAATEDSRNAAAAALLDWGFAQP